VFREEIAASFENYFKQVCLTFHLVEHEVTAEFKWLRNLLPLPNVAPLSFPSSVLKHEEYRFYYFGKRQLQLKWTG
jgi:hypothetical protein